MFSLPETQAHMQHRLNQYLQRRHTAAQQMPNICGNARCLIANWAAKFCRKHIRDLDKGKRLRSGQRIGPALVLRRGDERIHRKLCNVSHVDKGYAALSCRYIDAVFFTDIFAVSVAQILRKKSWPENCPAGRSGPKVLFDGVMWYQGITTRAGNRNKYDLRDALITCDVQKHIQGFPGI